MAIGVTTVGVGVPVVAADGQATRSVRTSAGVVATAARTVAPAATDDGNNSPAKGAALPVATPSAPPAQGDLIQLQSVVQGVNQFLRETQRQILFQFDPQTDKSSVTIVNPATGEIIRQIPSSQAITTGETLQQAGLLTQGLIFDESA